MNVQLLLRILTRAGYEHVSSTTDARQATEIAAREHPDIVLLDLHMPGMGGVEVMQALRDLKDWTEPYVVILTGDDTKQAKSLALSNGAKDFIAKPFDPNEVVLRIKNLVDLRRLHKALYLNNRSLEDKVRERTLELEMARVDIIDRLGMAAEFRDDATGQHTRRVGKASATIARVLGVDEDMTSMIERAAPLHDVGKIAIPDNVLLKPGPLAPAEMALMRTHTTIGARLLEGSHSQLLDLARDIALTHHERWDGSGYPQGLAGESISLPGRIVSLADFHDALSHDRPYRKRCEPGEVRSLIEAGRGRHFDPEVVDAFMESGVAEWHEDA